MAPTKPTAAEEPSPTLTKSQEAPISPSEHSPSSDTPADFETFYLQQVTQEFADDIDKLRNASDFNEKSLPVLIATLKQGAKLYSEEELGDGFALR
ncbi:hypothetical protein MMC07_006102 [Pseudocyphellaria aurata]|nr:hypothetical protein [Pseudocyphellaria aurata]